MQKKTTRRQFLKAAGGIGIAAAGAGIWGAVHKLANLKKQNVIVIVVDTLRHDALDCYGNPLGVSPCIDRIAADGVRFERAISTSGWTLPSIASLLTGTWPTIHGAVGKGPYQFPLRKEVPIAAEVFRKNGFDTLGLTNVTMLSPSVGFDRGFDVYDHHLSFDWKIRRADKTIDAALSLIRRHRSGSNFIFIHIFDPHINYDPPPGYVTKFTNGRTEPAPPLSKKQCISMHASAVGSQIQQATDYIKGVYYGEVNFADEHIGRLVDKLKQLELYDEAAIVITADHGEEFWEHDGFEHGHTVYDELTRVPLIIKPPAGIQPAKNVVRAQVRTIDVMPTLFELTGLEQPSSFIGRSLLPFITGETEQDLIAFSESTVFGSEKKCLRTERYAYFHDSDTALEQRGQLYDWRLDAGEQNDLIEKQPKIAQDLWKQLNQFYNPLYLQAQKMSRLVPLTLKDEERNALKSLGYIR